MAKRFYLVKRNDQGGMGGPMITHKVAAAAPDPEPQVTVTEVAPETSLFDWQPRPADFIEPVPITT